MNEEMKICVYLEAAWQVGWLAFYHLLLTLEVGRSTYSVA